MSVGIRVLPTKIDLRREADADMKKNARRAMTRSSGILLKHVQYQLLRGRGPQPSAPGEPPARQTGRLAKSFKRLRTRFRRGRASGGVTSDMKAAFALEYGETVGSRTVFAHTGSRRARTTFNKLTRGLLRSGLLGDSAKFYRVAPRPYLDPAAADAEPEITRILSDVIEL